jgi:hypothetical protein
VGVKPNWYCYGPKLAGRCLSLSKQYNDMLTTLNALFNRDLDKLKQEINSYKNEADLWLVPDGISNSAGNLCLHLIGNLNHFIGAQLGKTGYVREREREFSDKNTPVAQMSNQIDEVKTVIHNTLTAIDTTGLDADYPIVVFSNQQKVSTQFMLTHLAGHLAYHLGQINYHRRLLT